MTDIVGVWFSILMCILIFMFLVFTEIRNFLERKNLLDRIMSENYKEFAAFENDKEKIAAAGKAKIKRETVEL